MLRCSNHASVSTLTPVCDTEPTYSWQLAFTLPAGPQSCTLMTISPTVQRTKSMKAPMMTIPGRSWRWEMSQSMMQT